MKCHGVERYRIRDATHSHLGVIVKYVGNIDQAVGESVHFADGGVVRAVSQRNAGVETKKIIAGLVPWRRATLFGLSI